MPATILVAGDEPLIRWALLEPLSQDGHTILDADTAHAALLRFAPDIDLVQPDHKLPDSDVLQVLRAMARRRTGGEQTKAAALLGLNRDQIRDRIEKFGLDKAATA